MYKRAIVISPVLRPCIRCKAHRPHTIINHLYCTLCTQGQENQVPLQHLSYNSAPYQFYLHSQSAFRFAAPPGAPLLSAVQCGTGSDMPTVISLKTSSNGARSYDPAYIHQRLSRPIGSSHFDEVETPLIHQPGMRAM